MTNKELLTISLTEYGLPEDKASQIQQLYQPMLEKMVELEKEYNEIEALPMSIITAKKAKMLRQQYVKVRTAVAKIHKELKADTLKMARFIDAWKNAQLLASEGIEKALKDIETYYERIEQEKIDALQASRMLELQPFNLSFIHENLGRLDESIWKALLRGAQVKFEEKKAQEKQQKMDLYHDRLQKIIVYSEELHKQAISLNLDSPQLDYIFKIETTKFWRDQLTPESTDQKFQEIMEGLKNQTFDFRFNVDKLKEKEEKEKEKEKLAHLKCKVDEEYITPELCQPLLTDRGHLLQLYNELNALLEWKFDTEDYQAVYNSINNKLKECLDIITSFTGTKGA